MQTVRATQLELLAAVEEATGIELEHVDVDTQTGADEASEAMGKGDFSKMVNFIRRAIFAQGFGSDFEGKLGNGLVGVEEVTGHKAVVQLVEGIYQ